MKPSKLVVTNYDSRPIYWSAVVDEETSTGQIMKAPIDSPNEAKIVASDVYASTLAIDSGQLYWINLNEDGESTPFIGRMSLSNEADFQKEWFDTGYDLVFGLAAKFGYVYWQNMESMSIARVNVNDHSVVDKEFIDMDTLSYAGLAFDGSSIYWTSVRNVGDEDDEELIGSIKGAALATPTDVSTVVDGIEPSVPLVITGGSSPTPTPAPAPKPQAKKKQTPRSGAIPKKVKKRGVTVINKRNAKTKQGRPLTAKVSVKFPRGEMRCLTIKKSAKRKVTIRTYGTCSFRLKVTYTAPGNSKYLKFKKTKSYRI